MTTELDVSLALFEALLILVPVWVAVSKYLIQEGIRSESSDTTLSSYYLFFSYFLILGAFVMLRGSIIENIQSTDLLVAIDLLIGFVVVLFSSVYMIFVTNWMSESEIMEGEDEFEILEILDIDMIKIYYLVLIISAISFVFWIIIGPSILDAIYWTIRLLV